MPMSPRLLRPRATGFDPRSISGLVGWWDLSDAATLGSASTGPGGVTNNGPIKYVGDKSASGVAMVQTGADSVAPTYLAAAQNNRAVAGFDGGDSLICNFSRTFTSQTVFAVARLISTAAGSARLFTQTSSATDSTADFAETGHFIPLQRNGSAEGLVSYGGGANLGVVSVAYNSWFVACCRHTGTQVQNSVNNGTQVTGNNNLNIAVARMAIGRSLSTFGDHWRDRVGEVLVYDRAVTDTERTRIARELGRKWGITIA